MSNLHRFSKASLIMGVHAIQELLSYAPEKLIRVWTTSSKQKHDLCVLCEKKGVPIEYVSATSLTQLVDSESHQSFVAQIRPRTLLGIKEFLDQSKNKGRLFLLALDQIFDPQNFGALLRSAECFGVDGVIWSKNRGCDLTPTVAKASCGASEFLSLIRVSNLSDAIEKLKKADFEVIATVANAETQSLFQHQYAEKTVIILGSEGEGIQPLLQKKADKCLHIPLLGKIQSLNVAQTGAIFLSHRYQN